MSLRVEWNVDQQSHALVTRTARELQPEWDCWNVSAASEASNHTTRRSQDLITQEKLFLNAVSSNVNLQC